MLRFDRKHQIERKIFELKIEFNKIKEEYCFFEL